VVGDLELTYETMEIPADPCLGLATYSAEPGSASQDRLNFLEQAEPADATDRASSVRVVGPDTSINKENR
jgi:transcription regulator MmyB-like protein